MIRYITCYVSNNLPVTEHDLHSLINQSNNIIYNIHLCYVMYICHICVLACPLFLSCIAVFSFRVNDKVLITSKREILHETYLCFFFRISLVLP